MRMHLMEELPCHLRSLRSLDPDLRLSFVLEGEVPARDRPAVLCRIRQCPSRGEFEAGAQFPGEPYSEAIHFNVCVLLNPAPLVVYHEVGEVLQDGDAILFEHDIAGVVVGDSEKV